MKGCEDMNSNYLLSVGERLADIHRDLTSALLEKDEERRNLIIGQARLQATLLHRDVLDHATRDLMKEMGV